jgi:ABC-type amino acid transport substrate-binding protein
MRTAPQVLLTILVAALVSFGVVRYMPVTKGAAPLVQSKETALERVLRTNTLRCGYYNFPPMMVMYDDNGKPARKGFSNDMMEAIAQKTGLKIEWAEEVTFGNWGESLQAGRIDAVCTPVWPMRRWAARRSSPSRCSIPLCRRWCASTIRVLATIWTA